MDKHQDTRLSWLIAAMAFLSNILTRGVINASGIYHVIFMEKIENNSSAMVALITSFCYGTCSLMGVVSGILANKWGCRPVAVMGVILISLGFGLSSLATSVVHLYFTFGIIVGVGVGLTSMPNISILGLYFDKYRSVALGICMSGMGIGGFIFPPVINYLEKYYGWRGALLLISAICLHAVIFALFFRPVPTQTNQQTQETSHTSGIHLEIFTNFTFVVLTLQSVVVWFSIGITRVHLAAHVKHLGFSMESAAMALSTIGISDSVGRLVWGAADQIPCASSIALYFMSNMIQGVITIMLPFMESYSWIQVYAGMFGVLAGSYGVLMPQILAEVLGVGMFGVGIGYQYTIISIGFMAGGPVAGLLFDQTGVYSSAFYLGGGSMIFASLLLVFPWILMKPRHPTSTIKISVTEKV